MVSKNNLFVFVSIGILFMSFGNLFQVPSSGNITGTKTTTTFSNKVSNTFIVGSQNQVNLNFSSSLTDAVLFKTAFSTDTNIYIKYQLSAGWNLTKIGNAGGQTSASSLFIPKGSYNLSIFLGLALPYNANNPNTLINGSVDFSFSVTDVFNNVLNNSISFPTFNFSFNRSQISNSINNIQVLPPFYDQISNSLPVNTTFNFTRSEYNFGSATNNWGIVSGIGIHAIDNGSVSMIFNNSVNGFAIGRMYDPSNNSFTAADVPVGYPFSLMVLPANLTLEQFKNIFQVSWGLTLNSFNAVFFNNSDTLAVSMGINGQTGVFSFQYLYNRSSGALMYYHYNRTIQYSQFEELALDGTSVYPLSTPLFTTQDHDQSEKNISLNWQSQGQGIIYTVLLNGTQIFSQTSTSFSYSATNPGVYVFQLRAINSTSGLISTLSKSVIIKVTQSTTPSTSPTSSQSTSSSINQNSSTEVNNSNSSTSLTSSVDMNFSYFFFAILFSYALVRPRRNK